MAIRARIINLPGPKVENLTVDFSLQGVRNFKKEFDAMWEKSLPLE
jgi:hypothetical protein